LNVDGIVTVTRIQAIPISANQRRVSKLWFGAILYIKGQNVGNLPRFNVKHAWCVILCSEIQAVLESAETPIYSGHVQAAEAFGPKIRTSSSCSAAFLIVESLKSAVVTSA